MDGARTVVERARNSAEIISANNDRPIVVRDVLAGGVLPRLPDSQIDGVPEQSAVSTKGVDTDRRGWGARMFSAVASFFKNAFKNEWAAAPIAFLAAVPSNVATCVIMASIGPSLSAEFGGPTSAGAITAFSVLSTAIGYSTYLLGYYGGMILKERRDLFVDGALSAEKIREKFAVVRADFIAHLPTDLVVAPLMGGGAAGLLATGSTDFFWAVFIPQGLADLVYAFKEPLYWHGAKRFVAWRKASTPT